MKKIIAILLTLVMVLGLFAGCDQAAGNETQGKDPTPTGDQGTVSGGSETTGSDEPVKLTVWFKENLRIEDMETNEMTKWLEEQANVDLEFSLIPSSDMKTKVNMALTIGSIEDLPDIIIGNGANATQLEEWGEAGYIIPLNEYFDDPAMSPNFHEACERVGGIDLLKGVTSTNGNVYGIPTFNQSFGNEYPGKTWIYKPWLDALDEDIPTTTEEFYQLLKKVVNTDLNGNGKKDEIGMLGSLASHYYWFAWLMNSFVYAGDPQHRIVENGKVSVAYNTEEWKEGLAYIKSLFDEGLIPEEVLTISNDQYDAIAEAEEHTVFATCYFDALDENWVCVPPLVGPNGVQYATYDPTVGKSCAFYITANCKNPEAAFRLGDLMCSEYIGISQRWGLEGVNWDYAENVPDAEKLYKPSVEGFDLSIIVYDDGNFWGGQSITNNSWRQEGPYIRQYAIVNGVGVSKENADPFAEVLNAGRLLYQRGGWQPKEYIGALILTADENSIAGELEVNLKSTVQQFWAGVLTGEKDLEKDWDAYIQSLDAVGLEEYLKVVQTVYDRMNG